MGKIQKFIICLVFFLTIQTDLYAPDIVYPFNTAAPQKSEIKNLEWNRYTTKNFVILSINNSHGKWVSENIENIKSWCLTRWGFEDLDFSRECRIFFVPNKDLMQKLFNLDRSKIEFRKDLSVMWVLLDDKPERTVAPFISQVCLKEFEYKNSVKLSVWFKRGSSYLNGTLSDIRQNVLSLSDMLKNEETVFSSQKLFSMSEDDLSKEGYQNRQIFDRQSLALCLMLRKEFGEAKLQGFLRMANKNEPKSVLKFIYDFDSFDGFDKQYVRFMKDLTSDILNNKTPNSYLEINSAK
jgi:hypothetical protein